LAGGEKVTKKLSPRAKQEKIGFVRLKLPRKLLSALGGSSLGNFLTPRLSRFSNYFSAMAKIYASIFWQNFSMQGLIQF